MKTYYKIQITETAQNTLKESPYTFNRITEYFKNMEDLKSYFITRYGKIPKNKRKIYIDDLNGDAVEIGFLYSFWNKDYSHNLKSYFQTDWIEISQINEQIIINL